MKKLILLFVVSILLLLCACDRETEITCVSAYKSSGVYTDLGDEKLSREGLDALPKKYPGMPTQEARQICVDFWDYVKTALWIPDANYDLYKDLGEGKKEYSQTVENGRIYAGLPYVGSATGSIYRMLDFMDQENGVVNITEAGIYPLIFGNMCSNGCYWAWSRVMNSADYGWCNDSVVSRGYLPVGPYTYDYTILRLMDGIYDASHICQENGEQVMYQSYAAMQLADGLVSDGHTMMCTVAPHVEYNDDGTINGIASFLCITEQGGKAYDVNSAQGRPYHYEGGFRAKMTFRKLFEKGYIPYTFGELIGTDPIEETQVSFSHTGDTITEKQLFSAKVTSNYNISDVYVMVYDAQGNEVFKHGVRAGGAMSFRELQVHKRIGHVYTWGSWDDLDPKKDYTIKVEVQLGTGEHPVLWEGKLVQ